MQPQIRILNKSGAHEFSSRFTLGKGGFIFLPLILLAGCGASESLDVYQHQAALQQTISYNEWCQSWHFQKCEPLSFTPLPQTQWDASLKLFNRLMNDSKNRFKLDRVDFDKPAMKTLLKHLGAEALIGFFAQIPWKTLAKDFYSVELYTEGEQSAITLKGLKIIPGPRVTLTFPSDYRLINIRGLFIADEKGEQKQPLQQIALHKSGEVDLMTDKLKIEGVPVDFFSVENLLNQAGPTFHSLLHSVCKVAFDGSLDWKNKLQLHLTSGLISDLANLIKDNLPKENQEAILTILGAIDYARIPSPLAEFGEVAYVHLKPREMECKIKGIPFNLGKIKIRNVFGITKVEPLNDTLETYRAQISGIDVNMIGSLRSVDVNPELMILNFDFTKIKLPANGNSNNIGGGIVCSTVN